MANLITIQLMIPICLVILSHGHSTTTSSEIYPLIHLISYLIYYYYFKRSLIFLFFKKFFFPIHDSICDPVHDQIRSNPGFVNASTFLSTLSHNYFCIYMYHIIAARFRCWSHIDQWVHTMYPLKVVLCWCLVTRRNWVLALGSWKTLPFSWARWLTALFSLCIQVCMIMLIG